MDTGAVEQQDDGLRLHLKEDDDMFCGKVRDSLSRLCKLVPRSPAHVTFTMVP